MEDKNFTNEFTMSQMNIQEEDVRYYIDQLESNERFAMICSASIWVFISSLKWNVALNVVIWIPAIIVFYLAIKRLMITKTIHAKTEYLKEVEKELNIDEQIGWNTFWAKHKYGKWKGNKSYLKWWGRLFWSSLFIVNILIAYFVPFENILKVS